MSHSVRLSTSHKMLVPFSFLVPRADSKPKTVSMQSVLHTEQLAEAGWPYLTTSDGGVNTGLSVHCSVAVRKTSDKSLRCSAEFPKKSYLLILF